MNVVLLNSLIAGICLTLAGCCGLTRHFLLEPQVENFPRAPKWLLNVYFIFASVLMFAGLRFLNAYWVADTTDIPPNASPMMVLLASTILFYKGSMLVNVLNQYYPKEVWNRVNRVTHLLKCKHA